MRGLPRELHAPTARIKDLRPTQMTVGMREVKRKREQIRQAGREVRHLVPVILGPGGDPYVLDHHHESLALLKEEHEAVLIMSMADLQHLDQDSFWIFLDAKGWCHPYDSKGKRCDFDQIPKHLTGLQDDPYRSLAGELRRAGGFAKDTTPFSEFLWAQFLRGRVKKAAIKDDFDKALERAIAFARSREADFLPGWCGPHEG